MKKYVQYSRLKIDVGWGDHIAHVAIFALKPELKDYPYPRYVLRVHRKSETFDCLLWMTEDCRWSSLEGLLRKKLAGETYRPTTADKQIFEEKRVRETIQKIEERKFDECFY